MPIKFDVTYNKKNEMNSKYYIEIPENIWIVFKQGGRIKSKCLINGVSFNTSLIPKGDGKYVFQLTKKMTEKIGILDGEELSVEIHKIVKHDSVNLINSKDSLSKNIKYRKQISSYTCGQACVAMLLNKSVEEICDVIGKGAMGIGKIVEFLNSHGINNSQKNIRISKKNPAPSELSILTLKKNGHYHFVLNFDKKIFDPARGVLDDVPSNTIVSSYLEIY